MSNAAEKAEDSAAKISRTATEASGGVKGHNVIFVLGGSVTFIIIAFSLILFLR
jgi:hypothetical protein